MLKYSTSPLLYGGLRYCLCGDRAIAVIIMDYTLRLYNLVAKLIIVLALAGFAATVRPGIVSASQLTS
jgi:hypothetical protein